VARYSGEGGRRLGGADGEGESIGCRRIGRGVARRRDILGRRARQALSMAIDRWGGSDALSKISTPRPAASNASVDLSDA